jgi:hypothetical protein
MKPRAHYYLAFYGDLMMGCGASATLAIGDAVRNANEGRVDVEQPRIVGPVQLYDSDEELPAGATIAYAGSTNGHLSYGDIAVLVANPEPT